jgi:4-amino-4-deoxy-L-arabinose transferase-like glycosyltransferase
LYGLLRHLLLGPQWRWYCIGWAAAGFGIITKGVGFLPLLIFLPYGLLRSQHWQPRFSAAPTAKWIIGPVALLAATAVWLAPMLIAAHTDPAIAAYRDEILFRQTVTRYTDAWHHREPVWYFVVQVIPLMWLPLVALLPWLVPLWRRTLRERDLRIAVLLVWIVLVVAFFSLSSGKRGVYVLPAVPALALACAPYLRLLATRAIAQRWIFGVSALTATVTVLAVPYLLIRPDKRVELLEHYDFDPFGPLIAMALGTVLICALARSRRGFLAFSGSLTAVLLVISFWMNPSMDAARSGRAFIAKVQAVADPNAPLGFVAFKEQYLLHSERPVVHFGHARWRESAQEAADAARWLAGSKSNQLVVNEASYALCFKNAQREPIGMANRTSWYLVRGEAEPRCVAEGRPDAAYFYNPPNSKTIDTVLSAPRLQVTQRLQ